jgi:hypothetical protein
MNSRKGMNKDKHKLISPAKGILDLTLLTFKRGENAIEVSPKRRKRPKGLKSIIKEFLNR